MYALIISFGSAFLVGFGIGSKFGWGWGVPAGLLVYITSMLVISRVFTRRLKAIVEQVGAVWERSRDDIGKLANRTRNRQMTPKLYDLQMEQVQKIIAASADEAIAVLETAKPLYKWNIMAEKQMNTIRFQLLYQKKDFETADKYLDRVMLADAMTLCMKMVRLYKNDRLDECQKLYEKGIKKFKYDKGVLIYGLWSWILVKSDRLNDAVKVLDAGRSATESEVISRNWQAVANDKPKQFSNSGLGDEWYSLGLEKPQVQRASKSDMRNNPMVGRAGGKRRFR